MVIIAVIDDNNGMMFNKRRQSRDRVLCKKILDMTTDRNLWMNRYSEKIFEEFHADHVHVDESFISRAAAGDFCFIENISALPYLENIEKIILFRWNRKYPGDLCFDIDVHEMPWKMIETDEFAGSSHEKITMEVYVR